jgi:sulfatase modifying factor 1
MRYTSRLPRQHEDAYRLTFHATFQTPLTPVVTERNPRQVFISHAHQDSELAHRLAVDLERSGHPVWIAPESIRSGEDWVEAIGRGLDESAYFVVILTPAGVASRWVKREANLAARMAVDEELTFIPLWRESCRVPTLWDYQRVPFDQGYEAGLAALLARLGSGPVDTFRRNISAISPSAPPNRRIHEKTGIELIRIPAGPFLYGSADSDEMARADEKPQRTVNLPEYWIGRAPVTNAQFARFVQATGHRTTAEIKGHELVAGRACKWDLIAGADWRHPHGPESSDCGDKTITRLYRSVGTTPKRFATGPGWRCRRRSSGRRRRGGRTGASGRGATSRRRLSTATST